MDSAPTKVPAPTTESAPTTDSTPTTVPDHRGYPQWVTIFIKNGSLATLKLKNLNVSYGKLHANGNKDVEIDPKTLENYLIEPEDQLQINACGRSGSPSGTTGEFDICDVSAGDKVIRHCKWDCPYWSSKNTWIVEGNNLKWMVETQGANLDGGALGTITLEFVKKGK